QLLAVNPSSGTILARSATISPGPESGMMLAGRDGSLLVLSDASVYCHEPNTRLRWTRRSVGGSGNVGGAAVLTGGDYVVATAQGLVRLRPSGEPVWTNAFQRSLGTPSRWPAIAVDRDDVTYVRSRSALRAVSSDGELKWESAIRGLGSSGFQPILDSRDGIQVLFRGVVRRLNLEGAEVSEVTIGTDLSYSSSAVLDNRGRLFLQSDNGVLTAVDVGAGVAADAPWPLPRRDAGNRASLAGSAGIPPSPTGVSVLPWVGGNRVQWQASGHLVRHEIFRSAGSDFSQAVRIGNALASDEFFDDPGVEPGQGYHYWVVASNRLGSSGPGASAPSAGRAPSIRSRITIPGISTTPVLRPDESVVVADNYGRFTALDLEGRVLWTNQVSSRVAAVIFQLLAAEDGSTFFKADTGLHQLAADGSAVSRVIASPNVSMALGSDGLLRVATTDRILLRAPDGTTAGSAQTSGATDPHGAVRADGLILTSTTAGALRALDRGLNPAWESTPVEVAPGRVATPQPPAFGLDGSLYTGIGGIGIQSLIRIGPSGNLRWAQPLEPDTLRMGGPVLGPLDGLLYTTTVDRNSGRVLLAHDTVTGQERWRFRRVAESAGSFASTPAVTADATVLFGVGDTLWALDGADGSVRWGFQGNGRVGDVVLHGDGSIVFASGDELLVLRGSSPPAFSGWPMVRHDARGTAGQGMGGGRPVLLTRTAGEPGRLQLETGDGGPFLPLVSEDLTVWRPATGRFDLGEDSPGRIVPRFLPEVSGDRQFFRLVGP
ncbi:MAG: PQQ-binding-like beta-propeller repeat protein, partial [Verrucomicrobia bacterium]|nr:PQQ-binding-like beta-propeller repeat protein [Verrucomicrobiota bacterium]